MTVTSFSLVDLDDPSLVDLIGQRREDALAEAFRRHSGPVLGLALRVTRDRSLAEEVTQEVFVRLWNRPEAYDPDRGSLRSFLLSHTHGRAVDLIRSEASRRTREERDQAKAASSGPSLEEEVLELEMAQHVRSALETLSPDERDAIEMAYFGGHSYREVARLLDQPEGTIKSRIRTGLTRLHTQLSAKGIEL